MHSMWCDWHTPHPKCGNKWSLFWFLVKNHEGIQNVWPSCLVCLLILSRSERAMTTTVFMCNNRGLYYLLFIHILYMTLQWDSCHVNEFTPDSWNPEFEATAKKLGEWVAKYLAMFWRTRQVAVDLLGATWANRQTLGNPYLHWLWDWDLRFAIGREPSCWGL